MWMNTLLLTFVFFLIQLGTGLSILAIVPLDLIRMSRLTKIQFVVLGYAIGASAVGIILGLCSVLVGDIRLHLAIVIALSAFGLAWTWPAWRPRTGDAGQIMLWCLLSLPIALATWWWTFGAFSHFPYSDIGADVHWMKTAQEYADSGVINPYASQSYVDLRSALAGVLSGTFGLDLLHFGWVYRYGSILFFLLAFYAFAEGLYAEPMRKWITFFFAAAGNGVGLLTNGSLALAGSVVFLGVLLGNVGQDAKEDVATDTIVWLILGAATSLLVAFMLNNNALVVALLAGGLFVLRILGKANRRKSILFVGWVWPATLLLAHRGSYLFIPAVLAAWLSYLLILREMARRPAQSLRILRALSVVLPLIICGIVASIVAMRLGYIPAADANVVFSHITKLVLGRTIESGEELFLGTGPQVAVIELGRAMGPLFAVCIAMAMAWWWIDRSTTTSETASSPVQTVRVSKLLWSWTIGCSLTIAVLSGFPFLYRTTMIVLALLTITATETFCQLLVDPSPASYRRRASAAITITLLAAGLALAVYAFAWRPDLPSARYQDFLRPTEIAGAVLLVALVPLTLIRSRWIHVCALAAIVGLGIGLDRAGVSGMSKSYSYGPLPSGASAITHYDASDLDTTLWLRANLKKGILLSDPYTLSLIQSMTGAPAAYTFSNLDTVNEATARRVRTVLSAIVEPADGARRLTEACAAVRPVLQEINQETYFQMRRADALAGILRPVRPTKAPETTEPEATAPNIPGGTEAADRELIHDLLGTGNDTWQVIAVINPRTIEWLGLEAGQRLSYFPPTEPLDSGFIKLLRAGPFQALFANKQTVVVRIPCER